MKYIISQSLTHALSTICYVESNLSLVKNKHVTTYAEPEMISNISHELSGHYVIPIADSGWLKCDQLFDSQLLVDQDFTWFDTISASD
jgi:hypothetical protein